MSERVLPVAALAAILALAACGSATGGGPVPRGLVVEKTTRPAERGLPQPAVTGFCDGAETRELVAGAPPDTLTGDTAAGDSLVAAYACVAWDERGREVVYRLVVTGDIVLKAILDEPVVEIDHDLFLLTACDSDACLAHANLELAAELPPGEYWLVVDGYRGDKGPYTLILEARTPGVPQEVCTGASAPIVCTAGAFADSSTLFGEPNRIEAYACSPYLESGGERWYVAEVAPAGGLSVSAGSQDLDLALWLFDGCGPAPACLGFADATLAGAGEVLDFANEDGAVRTVYLAVDSLRPAASEATGSFTLAVDCLDPAVPDTICAEGGNVPVACQETPAVESGTLFGRDNRVGALSCGTGTAPAGEAWFAVTVEPGAALTATVAAAGMDACLWLLDGCGAAGACLGFADAAAAGGDEVLTRVNETEEAQVLYLGVDAREVPADGTAGAFTLTLVCTPPTPVERTSLGAWKARFR